MPPVINPSMIMRGLAVINGSETPPVQAANQGVRSKGLMHKDSGNE
jgi:hypothetical protein